jgi:hypothetical protein
MPTEQQYRKLIAVSQNSGCIIGGVKNDLILDQSTENAKLQLCRAMHPSQM